MDTSTDGGASELEKQRTWIPTQRSVVLLDCENVGDFEPCIFPKKAALVAFVGVALKRSEKRLQRAADLLAGRFQRIDCIVGGRNALDFQLACYLGMYLQANPHAEYVLLSRDQGFNALMRCLRQRGFRVRRADNQAKAYPSTWRQAEERMQRMRDWLRNTPPEQRPTKRAALLQALQLHFGREVGTELIEYFVVQMQAKGEVQMKKKLLVFTY
jgi:hypothetical protein